MAVNKKVVVTHVIFDLDGNLINSSDALKKSFHIFAERHGKQLTPETESII